MVIRLAIQYCKRPVNLLQQECPHHLVGEGHFRQRQQFAAPAELFRETVGAADGKNQLACSAVALLTDKSGQSWGVQLFARLVQQDQGCTGGNMLLQSFALTVAHLFRFRTLFIADVYELQRHVTPDAAGIFIDRILDPRVTALADPQNFYFQ